MQPAAVPNAMQEALRHYSGMLVPPYVLQSPGQTVMAEGLKLIPRAGAYWVPVEASDIGQTVPQQGVLYAQIDVPYGYRTKPGTSRINRLVDLYYDDFDKSWSSLAYAVQFDGHTYEDIRRVWTASTEHRGIVVEPDPAVFSNADAPYRIGDRDLFIGETIRPGDVYLTVKSNEWLPVDTVPPDCVNGWKGLVVPGAQRSNGFIRFARPVGLRFINWFVNESAAIGGDGTHDRPWSNMETAEAEIAAIRKVNPQIGGYVWKNGMITNVIDPDLEHVVQTPLVPATPGPTPIFELPTAPEPVSVPAPVMEHGIKLDRLKLIITRPDGMKCVTKLEDIAFVFGEFPSDVWERLSAMTHPQTGYSVVQWDPRLTATDLDCYGFMLPIAAESLDEGIWERPTFEQLASGVFEAVAIDPICFERAMQRVCGSPVATFDTDRDTQNAPPSNTDKLAEIVREIQRLAAQAISLITGGK